MTAGFLAYAVIGMLFTTPAPFRAMTAGIRFLRHLDRNGLFDAFPEKGQKRPENGKNKKRETERWEDGEYDL